MRRFFIFLFIFFGSLFFSQCEIGEISFALEDVLIFFKVEEKNKNNEIQYIDEINLKADEKPENEFQVIARIELKAKKKEQNILQNIQEISILAKQRYKNENGGNESIKLLEKEKPQIEPKVNDAFYFSGVARPQNGIEKKDKILIEEKKKEDLKIVKVNNLLFSKKEQQKKTNELYKAGNFEIFCAKKKNQNSICRTEPFEIVTVIPRKFRAQVLSSENNENFSFLPKVTTSKNNKIIEGEKIQIYGKESAKVIELRKKADEMYKALQEYEKRHNEVFEVIHEDGMDEISQIKDPEIAIPKIIEIVREKAKKNMMKEGKIKKDDILDTKKMEEIMKANDYSKSERKKTKTKKADFEKELLDLKSNHLNLCLENMQLLVAQQKLAEELCKIKENSGCNNEKTPCAKNPVKEHKYQESGIILSQDNTQKKNSRNKFGYSRDKDFIDEQNEIKEERQSMWSSISRNLDFSRPASHSPRKNNRNSFFPFFDVKKFYTDPREKNIEISNIYDIPQRGSYLFFCGNGLNKKVRNVSIDFKECPETSFQIKNVNEAMKLNNVNEVVEQKEEKKFKKINIKRGINNKNKERETTAVNTSKYVISLNKSTTNVSKLNVIKNNSKNIKDPKSKGAGKKLGTSTSFNTFNKSNTSLSNSGMYGNKMEDKNIINNSFEQKKIKNNLGMPRRNEEKDIKRLSYFGGVKGDVSHNFKKQTDIKKNLLKGKKETTKSRLPQKNNDEAIEKFYAKIRALQQQKKTSGAHTENQKLPQQNIINRLTENNAGRKDTKRDLNKVEDKKIVTYNSFRNIKKEKSVISKNSENSNNNSNSFVSLGGKGNSINLDAKRLKEKKNDMIKKGEKRKDNLQDDKKVPTKTSLLTRFKRNKKEE